MRLKERLKRRAALALAAMLTLTCMPMGVLAEEVSTPSDCTTTEVTVIPTDEETVENEEPETEMESSPENTSEPVADNAHPLQIALEEHGSVYARTMRSMKVYADAALKGDVVYTTPSEASLMLVTDFTRHNTVKVWFLDEAYQVVSGYVDADTLDSIYLLPNEVESFNGYFACKGMTDVGWMSLFVVNGNHMQMETDSTSAEEQTPEFPTEDQNIVENKEDVAEMIEVTEPVMDERQAEEPIENGLATETDATSIDESAAVEDEPSITNDAEPIEYAGPNDYIGVTTATRVLFEVDESAAEDYYCDVYLGNFVSEATVQVMSVETDGDGNVWYQVCYLYGDTFKNGSLKWTESATALVLASETCEPFDEACTVTDYAYTDELLQMSNDISFYASAMDGFTLKSISGSIGSFYAGQSNLYGSSGKDSAYPQLAKVAGHGTVYATPHYLEGYTVYCLEHTLAGPGEGSGSSKTATGPYALVTLDEAAANGLPFKASTMHAIAWILRHSYPFMALNRSDSNNEVWSRAAGQFAIREVIKQLEGSQYVRDYWNMDNFYSFTGGAPTVYLTYAKWLATNGIARAGISGGIAVSNQSVRKSGGSYIGTVTLSTDADLIRIAKTVGTVSGNTGGEDTAYYYAQSGDTIQVTSSASTFTVPMESLSSASEEASFLVGIPSASIQKVLVPVSGDPYPLQSTSVTFTAPQVRGMIQIIKTDSVTGKPLEGAEFTVTSMESNEKVAVFTTDANGIAQTEALPAGQYRITETGVPDGYVDAGFETTITIE